MYRVIIADDEPWVVYSLVHSINWESLDFTICSTADNGPRALEACLMHQPDLLVSDIRMPGMDGLELLETLRKQIPDIEVIFITGYAEFDYAQRAVRHGAADYLVKQVSANQLTETLERLRERLDQKKNSILNDAYFSLLDENDSLAVGEWANCSSQYKAYSHFRCVTYSVYEDNNLYSTKQTWQPELGFFTLRTGRNKYLALVGYTSIDAFEQWLNNFGKRNAQYLGISKEVNSSYSFSNLHKQSDIAFCTAIIQHKEKPLIYNKKYPDDSEGGLSELIKIFEKDLMNNDYTICLQLLNQMCTLSNGMMLDKIADIINIVISLYKRYLPIDSDALETLNYRRLSSDFANLEAVFDYLKQILLTSDNLTSTEFLGQNILQFIDTHYTEELRLPELAARYHFSPSYFSTLFKKHTGTTLTKYITAKRITLAKQLLSDSSLSLQDVVERIGYNDYFQFIKIFKREVGVTPGQFRNN